MQRRLPPQKVKVGECGKGRPGLLLQPASSRERLAGREPLWGPSLPHCLGHFLVYSGTAFPGGWWPTACQVGLLGLRHIHLRSVLVGPVLALLGKGHFPPNPLGPRACLELPLSLPPDLPAAALGVSGFGSSWLSTEVVVCTPPLGLVTKAEEVPCTCTWKLGAS